MCVCLCRFSAVQKHTVEFNQLAMANSEGSEAMLNRVMTKDNIGVAVLLEVRKEMMEASCEYTPPKPNTPRSAAPSAPALTLNVVGASRFVSSLPPPPHSFSRKVASRHGEAAAPHGQRPHALGPRVL